MITKLKNNAKKDTQILTLTLFCILGLFIYFDIGDMMGDWVEEHEEFELDEILITLSVGSIAFAWFAHRRWKEYSTELINRAGVNQLLVQEIAERKRAEVELVQHRNNLQNMIDEATDELKVQSDDLKQALLKEKEYNQLQSQLVSMASHEFRTPLAIIDGAAQRLMKQTTTPISEEAMKRVTKIRNAVQRMTMLTDSMLSASKMDEAGITVNIAPCKISEILTKVCNRQQDITSDHVISCSLSDIPATIQADYSALEQVFTNLLSNAVKYAPRAPNIEVAAHSSEEHVVFTVTDEGVGIDAYDLPKIFERFFRAETSIGIAGTGIGLNLVKSLVELHDGSISVDSRKDKGSTFTIRLPIDGPDQSMQAASKAA